MGYSLDDYIYSLEARGGARGPGGGGGADSDADVHAQLLAKERDLILAAELGKALLEKNEELSKQNEKIAEEFSQKLEVGVAFQTAFQACSGSYEHSRRSLTGAHFAGQKRLGWVFSLVLVLSTRCDTSGGTSRPQQGPGGATGHHQPMALASTSQALDSTRCWLVLDHKVLHVLARRFA